MKYKCFYILLIYFYGKITWLLSNWSDNCDIKYQETTDGLTINFHRASFTWCLFFMRWWIKKFAQVDKKVSPTVETAGLILMVLIKNVKLFYKHGLLNIGGREHLSTITFDFVF